MFFPITGKITGQEIATRLIYKFFKISKDYQPQLIGIEGYNRKYKLSPFHWVKYINTIFFVYFNQLYKLSRGNSILYLNMGQTFKSIILEGVPFVIACIINSNNSNVISLHGEFFIFWKKGIKRKIFIWVLSKVTFVTVLSKKQKQKLNDLGINLHKVVIINNTCDIDGAGSSTNNVKYTNILFLSNLIDTKGFREYLDAIKILSQKKYKINAYLVGDLTRSYLNTNSVSINEKYINNVIQEINKSQDTKIHWIRGLYGVEKTSILNKTDIFVLPSKKEAQPIVIIEAMAFGCAIIASNVGEIPNMLKERSGIVLKDTKPSTIAENVISLITNRQKLVTLQRNAKARFNNYFSNEKYISSWRSIFSIM